MDLELLVPTMHRSKEDIIKLFNDMHVTSDVIFANQCDEEWEEEFKINSFNVHVISTKTRGISKNRNILIKHLKADYGLFMDDDGIMSDNYSKIALNFVKRHPDAKFIKFNFTLSSTDDERPHYIIKESKKAKYPDMSPFGMPGFMIARDIALNEQVKFNEKVGVPNYIFNGEDSLFIKLMFDLKVSSYVSKDFIGHINNDDSSWFQDFNEQYFISRGYLYSAMHGNLYWLYVLRMYLIHHKEYHYKYRKVRALTKRGHKLYKKEKNND